MKHGADEASILAIDRPDPKLWTYYILCCLAVLPLAPLLLPIHWFRYHSMRYRFTDEGVSMSWGILFRRQILLNYARIQDIHLHSNVVERWLGLARLQIQTASGSASAEMTLEGLTQFEEVRDFLYSRMRGVKEVSPAHPAAVAPLEGVRNEDLAALLREIAQELRALREALPAKESHGERTTDV